MSKNSSVWFFRIGLVAALVALATFFSGGLSTNQIPQQDAASEVSAPPLLLGVEFEDMRRVGFRFSDDELVESWVRVDHVTQLTDLLQKQQEQVSLDPVRAQPVNQVVSISVSEPVLDFAQKVQWIIYRAWTPEKGWHENPGQRTF
ncbi:MAG: hypothetical protein HQ488_01015 [Parcubacteria group bacterium]|nr:hypothetical protein [Parcubacteria group bacterium]